MMEGVNSTMTYLGYCKYNIYYICKYHNVHPAQQQQKIVLGMMARAFNPRYSGGRDQEDCNLRPAGQQVLRPHLN
jgi:hypothetical protein